MKQNWNNFYLDNQFSSSIVLGKANSANHFCSQKKSKYLFAGAYMLCYKVWSGFHLAKRRGKPEQVFQLHYMAVSNQMQLKRLTDASN